MRRYFFNFFSLALSDIINILPIMVLLAIYIGKYIASSKSIYNIYFLYTLHVFWSVIKSIRRQPQVDGRLTFCLHNYLDRSNKR